MLEIIAALKENAGAPWVNPASMKKQLRLKSSAA